MNQSPIGVDNPADKTHLNWPRECTTYSRKRVMKIHASSHSSNSFFNPTYFNRLKCPLKIKYKKKREF
jgi:hypothetical protein